MRQEHVTVVVRTPGRGLVPFHREVEQWLAAISPRNGLLTVFIQHTSASLLIQENADPGVRSDLDRWLSRLVKDGDPIFEHSAEGIDDMPAHVRAALTQTHLAVPVIDGKPVLGAWQGLYVFEHRHSPHTRRVVLHYLGD